MLVDRLAYHMAVNAIQSGGFDVFYSEGYYNDDNELFRFISSTPEYSTAQKIVRYWLRKQETADEDD